MLKNTKNKQKRKSKRSRKNMKGGDSKIEKIIRNEMMEYNKLYRTTLLTRDDDHLIAKIMEQPGTINELFINIAYFYYGGMAFDLYFFNKLMLNLQESQPKIDMINKIISIYILSRNKADFLDIFRELHDNEFVKMVENEKMGITHHLFKRSIQHNGDYDNIYEFIDIGNIPNSALFAYYGNLKQLLNSLFYRDGNKIYINLNRSANLLLYSLKNKTNGLHANEVEELVDYANENDKEDIMQYITASQNRINEDEDDEFINQLLEQHMQNDDEDIDDEDIDDEDIDDVYEAA